MCLTATPIRKAAQKVAFATSKKGLDREAWAAFLRVRTQGLNALRATEGTNLR